MAISAHTTHLLYFPVWYLDSTKDALRVARPMVVGAVWTEDLRSLLLVRTPSALQNTIYSYGVCIVLGTLGHLEVMYFEEV